MAEINKLDDMLSVCGQVTEGDIIIAAGLGFKAVINNRPDGEAAEQPLSETVEAWVKQQGMVYHYLPVSPNDLPFDKVADFGEIYGGTDSPVLAFCTTGMRSSVLWGLMMAVISDGEVDEIVDHVQKFGYDISTLRAPLHAVRRVMGENKV